MSGDHLGPGADHDLADITANLDLVVGIGDRHRVVVAAVAHHRDRGRPSADLLTGIVGRRRQHHQRVEIPQQPLADRLGMAAEYGILPLEALLFQPGVQRLEALEPGHRHQEVSTAEADHTLHVALVVPLAGATEAILEQVVRLQLGEGDGSLAGPVAEDLRHREGGVVEQDRLRHAAEEGEGRDMAVAERLGRLGRIRLDEERIRVRERHREVVQLALDPADLPDRLAKVHLGVARRMRRRSDCWRSRCSTRPRRRTSCRESGKGWRQSNCGRNGNRFFGLVARVRGPAARLGLHPGGQRSAGA